MTRRLLKRMKKPKKEVVSVPTPMPSEQIKQKHTREELFNLKWNTIMVTIFLKQEYGITPKEMESGVDLFRWRGGEELRLHLMQATIWQNLYNENPLDEVLTDEYLQ